MPFATGLRYRDGVPIVYDPADYRAAFDRLLDRFEYGEWRIAQQARRGSTTPIGIGLSAYLEGTGIGPFEGADVRIDPSGLVYLQIGVSSQGQAHETTLAQVCAAELGVDTERVVVVGGDTAVLGYGNGTIASRVAAVAGPAVARTSREVARKARLVAGELLECALTDVVFTDGRAHVAGMAGRSIELGELARGSLRSPTLLREGAPGLHACAFFRPETVTWAFGAHACALEVDALDFPSTRNEMGIKGVGESGIIAPVPAVANAVEDALGDRGVAIERVPLTAASVWEALRSAQRPAGSR